MINLCEANAITGKDAAAESLKEKKRGAEAATERLVTAMQQYAEMGTGYRVSDAAEGALRRIALQNWASKAELREILRKSPNWDEELQEVTTEITTECEINWYSLRQDVRTFARKNAADAEAAEMAVDAAWIIAPPETVEEVDRQAYKALTGHTFNPRRKLSKSLREILIGCGAWDDAQGSDCQKKFAEWANVLNGQTEKRKIHLSICPAIQMTESNPHEDKRGRTLISCHSLDNQDYGYSAGNAGYATDNCTMVLYTCAGSDRYTRKTSRQLYMYSNGTLLQSRLYDTNGANDYGDKITAIYRATVQAIIADCLGVENDWTEPENAAYCGHIHTNSGFGGYPDYEYSGTGCTVSHLASWDGYSRLDIGGPGICISCGAYTYDDCGAICTDCDTQHTYCACCRDRITVDAAHKTVYGEWLCEWCVANYTQCDCCGLWTDTSYYIYGTGETLCEDCFTDGDYAACDYCGDWYDADDLEAVKVYGCRRHADGQTLYVCDCCRGDLDAGGHLTAPEAEED